MLNDGTDALSMFQLYTAYFYKPDTTTQETDDLKLAEFIFRTKGGIQLHDKHEIVSSPTRLTHIFVNDLVFDQDKFQEEMLALGVTLHDVTVIKWKWIRDCHANNRLICEQSYIVLM